jgi:hypothetical protein
MLNVRKKIMSYPYMREEMKLTAIVSLKKIQLERKLLVQTQIFRYWI